MTHDLVHRDPRNRQLADGYQPGSGLCKCCSVKPGEWYYDDGRLLCENCLSDAIEVDAE